MLGGEVTEEQAVKIVDEMFAIPEHWRHEDMARGKATHITKYSLAVETKHENDRLIAALRESGKAITWTADEDKVRNVKLVFWGDIKLSPKQRETSNTLQDAKDALMQAFVNALNNGKTAWVQAIIDELEEETDLAVAAASDEIEWLHSQMTPEKKES